MDLRAGLRIWLLAAACAAALHAAAATEVMFFLDTEDYTDPDTADSIKHFAVTDLSRLPAPAPRRIIRRGDLPSLKMALERSIEAVGCPASWCVADVFLAVVGFLRGEEAYVPGKVYGFLSEPRGVKAEVEVSRVDLVRAAKAMDVSKFLPPSIRVGNAEIGPADFLMAALEALTTDAERFAIRPREQLGDLSVLPELKAFRLKGTWVHTPELEDRYLSDRLRWQFWTLRRETACP